MDLDIGIRSFKYTSKHVVIHTIIRARNISIAVLDCVPFVGDVRGPDSVDSVDKGCTGRTCVTCIPVFITCSQLFQHEKEAQYKS